MKLENKQLLKETTEKEIMVFCPNCVSNPRGFTLKEIVKANSKPISSLATCKDDGEKYWPETDDWLIFKHFKCESCGESYIGTYNLVLEKNLTLDEAYESAKEDGNRIGTTYRVKRCENPCPAHCEN